jgi:colanic acid biosynthesis glycosyl transferase WcaI
MKIVVHDYAGHPFQVQLSRALVVRGHDVLHVYAGGLQTPRGELDVGANEVAGLRVRAVEVGSGYVRDKYSFFRRRRLEVAYGEKVAALVRAERPDVVVSANTPTEAQELISEACQAGGARFYDWMQDFYSVAVDVLARRRWPVVGALAGGYYRWLEGRRLRRSDGVVAITGDFVPVLRRQFRVPADKITVIPNWAPLDSLPVQPKRTRWSEAHGLADKYVYLYSGTLGLKHNPALLLELARRHRHNDAIRVVVVSEGLGADWLREQTAADPLPNLVQLPYQPFQDLPEVLGAADVLIGLLEEEAGVFPVPSKVLSYLCAARPILLAAPSVNLATRLVARERVGMTCAPTDVTAFLDAADHLRTQSGLGAAMGRRARAYAERTFPIDPIADRFERVLRNEPADVPTTAPAPGVPVPANHSPGSGTGARAMVA